MINFEQKTIPGKPAVLEFFHVAVAVAYVAVWALFIALQSSVATVLIWVGKVSGMERILYKVPGFLLAIGWIPCIYLTYVLGGSSLGESISKSIFLTCLWGMSIYFFLGAYFVCTQGPDSSDEYANLANQRWPDKWYAKYLKRPIDAVYIRQLVANSVVVIPATVSLVMPGGFEIFSIIFYVLAVGRVFHEGIDHVDIHNKLFRSDHLSSGYPKAVIWVTEKYLRLVLNPLCWRPPHFYRAQHVYMHHVENNGLEDLQSTLVWDRTSFFDFCKQSFKLGLSWAFAVDIFSYLIKKRNYRQVRLLALGMFLWVAYLSLIAVFNPFCALAIFTLRFLVGPDLAGNSYYWHGLVDLNRPWTIEGNSVAVRSRDLASSEPGESHIRHHQKGGGHWFEQMTITPIDIERSFENGALVFASEFTAVLMLKALFLRRFDLIEQNVIKIVKGEALAAQSDSTFLAELELRTRPAVKELHGPFWHKADRVFARIFCKCI